MDREFGFWQLDIPPENAGFGQFSAGHAVWLAACVIICCVLKKVYEGSERKTAVRRTISLSVLSLELLMAAFYAANRMYGLWTLPLHLCGISVFLEVLHAFRENSTLGQFLYAFSFPGAVFALLFPDWSYFPLYNVQTVIEFLKHILLTAYVVMQVKDIAPDIKKTPKCLLFMVVLAVPVYVFDKLTQTNYMFLNWPVMPLTLFSNLGRPGYLFGYLPLLAASWAVIYLPFIPGKKRKS